MLAMLKAYYMVRYTLSEFEGEELPIMNVYL